MAHQTYTTRDFVEDHGIEIRCEPIDRNPHLADDAWARTAYHYECSLIRDGSEMKTYFSQGTAIKGPPSAEGVLDSLASDAQSIVDYGLSDEDFEQWAADLGFDPDSRSAERTFRMIHEQSNRLMRFLGRALYNKLLHSTERL